MTVSRSLGALLAVVATLVLGCGGDEKARPDLVFVSTRDGDYAIYEMNADGAGQRRLTDRPADSSSPARLFFQVDPAWSPDGTQIAFASRRRGPFDIYVMNADGTSTRRLTSTREWDGRPTWSPDGSRIAFARNEADIYVMNTDGTGVERVTDSSASESEPAWSPDGRWIAFMRRPQGADFRELWLMRPDGSGQQRLTSLGAKSAFPAWSPDGARIVFASDASEGGLYDIYVITVETKRVRRLTSTGADAFEPAWSPDGSTIAFTRDGAIVTIDLAGSEETISKAANNDVSPVWNPVLRPDSESS
ncbi:MAG TPA: hypothetical protein VMR89_06225 [Actinomycetota bacterium]|nr:hypothetical protein [Actinomycetota bacterium]